MKGITFLLEVINKMALSSNDDKRIQSIDSIETYPYGMSTDLICKKEKIKCNNIKNNTKMFNSDYATTENIKNIIQIGQTFLTIHIEY